MNIIKKNKKILVLILVFITIFIIIFATKKIAKNKKTNETQLASTYTEAIEEPKNETENMVVPLEINDEETNDVSEDNPEDTSWDEDAEETKVDVKEEKKAKETSTAKYFIRVNYTANVVTIYTKDSEGNYTVPVKALVCSSGVATPTSGMYKMSNKYRWHLLNGGVYGQYCTRITGHILFHSVPYETNSPDSLKYTAYDKLGTTASAGCIRLTVQDAMWIYNNCASGTYVEFYSSSDPGPLGKPSAQKISLNVDCRNWDPTDPDSRNPWHGYVAPKNTEVVQEVKQQETTNKTEDNKSKEINNESNNEIKKENTTTLDTQEDINANKSTNSSTNQTTDKTQEQKEENESANNNQSAQEQQKQTNENQINTENTQNST